MDIGRCQHCITLHLQLPLRSPEQVPLAGAPGHPAPRGREGGQGWCRDGEPWHHTHTITPSTILHDCCDSPPPLWWSLFSQYWFLFSLSLVALTSERRSRFLRKRMKLNDEKKTPGIVTSQSRADGELSKGHSSAITFQKLLTNWQTETVDISRTVFSSTLILYAMTKSNTPPWLMVFYPCILPHLSHSFSFFFSSVRVSYLRNISSYLVRTRNIN